MCAVTSVVPLCSLTAISVFALLAFPYPLPVQNSAYISKSLSVTVPFQSVGGGPLFSWSKSGAVVECSCFAKPCVGLSRFLKTLWWGGIVVLFLLLLSGLA